MAAAPSPHFMAARASLLPSSPWIQPPLLHVYLPSNPVASMAPPPPTPWRVRPSPVSHRIWPSPTSAGGTLPRSGSVSYSSADGECVRTHTIQRACATAVAHQVGHGRTAMLYFKCFWMLFQTCCKPMFQVFQMYISIVLCECCKSRSGCCNSCTRCCKRLSQYFICFLYTYVASVSDACLKCLICFLLYVASVASRCFKSRSGCCTCCNGISTICHRYFICFRRMLQRFHLDFVKVDLVFKCCSGTHLPQPPACSCWARVHACRSGGARAVDVDRYVAPHGHAQAMETERRRPPREAGVGVRASVAGASIRTLATRSDVRALAVPLI